MRRTNERTWGHLKTGPTSQSRWLPSNKSEIRKPRIDFSILTTPGCLIVSFSGSIFHSVHEHILHFYYIIHYMQHSTSNGNHEGQIFKCSFLEFHDLENGSHNQERCKIYFNVLSLFPSLFLVFNGASANSFQIMRISEN